MKSSLAFGVLAATLSATVYGQAHSSQPKKPVSGLKRYKAGLEQLRERQRMQQPQQRARVN